MRCSAWLAALALLLTLPASAMAYRLTSDAPLAEVVSGRALRYGDTGPAVAQLQELLRQSGFDPGPADGIFGPLTEAAVIQAQRHFGLEVDGLAGRMTVAALEGRSQTARPKPTPPAAAVQREGGVVSESGLMIYDARQRHAGPQEAAAAPGQAVEAPHQAMTAPQQAVAASHQAMTAPPQSTAAPARAAASQQQTAAVTSQAAAAPGQAPAAAQQDSASKLAPAAATDAAPGARQAGVATAQAAALTFHRLPEPEALPALLQYLNEQGARATFFVTGMEAERRADDLQRIRAAGHDIGSLGWREVDMRSLSPRAARRELRRAGQAIAAAVGEPPALFRPPLGRFDRQLTRLAAEEGMRLVLWSNAIAPGGAGSTPEKLAVSALKALHPGAVIMVPLDASGGVAAAQLVLEGMAEAGYRTQRLFDVVSDRN